MSIIKKNRNDLFDILAKFGDINFAISNAEKLDNQTGIVKGNPSTGVYKFLKHFQRYIE